MPEQQNQASSFGDWLRRRRKARDWTQAELAQRVGCAIITIKKIETAQARPSKHLAMRIVIALDIPPEERETIVRAARDLLAADRLPPPLQPERSGLRDPAPVPARCHQLRSPLPDFVGQHAIIATLLTCLRQATHNGSVAAISGVRGMGGIGKTELAVLVANCLTETFPDAQIMLNLRGAGTTPLLPHQALHQVIHAFSPDLKLPDELEASQQHYHSLLHGKRVLIVADDARDAAQVRPLLPPKGCALLITSRLRFSLPGMTSIDLEVLTEAEAIRLLRSLCTRLSEADARRLAHSCGYLPLALRVSGSLLHNDPALSVVTYLQHLAEQRQRLDHLRDPNDPELDVETTLRLSYGRLEPEMQEVFRQLGVLVADFTSELAQAVVQMPAQIDIEAMLHTLLRHNLVMYDTERRRWRLHDLLRDLGYHQLEAASETEAVQWRYAGATVALATHIQEQYFVGGEPTLAALSQFDTERAHIDAAHRWAQRMAGTPAGDQLLIDAARASRHIENLRYDPQQESIPLWEQVQMAARRLGDQAEEGRALGNLGAAYYHLGELHTAISYYRQCLVIACNTGNRFSQATTLRNSGMAYACLGELYTAITYNEQALAIFRDLGNRRDEAYTLLTLGDTYYSLSEPHTAITYQKQALVIAREIGDHRAEGITLGNLSLAYTDVGDTWHAIACCEEAVTISRAIKDRRGEAYTLSYLARAQAIQGDKILAIASFTQAMTLFQEISNRWGAAECQWLFGLALTQQGECQQALPLLRASVAYEQEIGHVKAAEHAALVARLEAGGELPAELCVPTDRRAIEDDQKASAEDEAQP